MIQCHAFSVEFGIFSTQYAAELPKLTRKQLEQISNPQILDDDQQELMGLHCKLNHLPLPAMIALAKKGKAEQEICFIVVCIHRTSNTNIHMTIIWYQHS
jgi:hypothetical protein